MHRSMDREKFDKFYRIALRPAYIVSLVIGLAACAPMGTAAIKAVSAPGGIEDGQGDNGGELPDATPAPTPPPQGGTPTPTPPPVSSKVVPDNEIALDATGESFQRSIATRLQSSRYMEKNCTDVASWNEWQGLPMKRCRYTSSGQTVEVLMLNPGPRRLTLWLQEACMSLGKSVSSCMTSAFNHIMGQSGAQFPVAGIVVEDMDGNGRGNLYCFRNGVTVQVPSFGTATESAATSTWINGCFNDKPTKTYSYARPISATRSQLNSYSRALGFMNDIPTLSTSATSGAASNLFNEVTGDLYRDAWYSSQNHIIRAWIHANL